MENSWKHIFYVALFYDSIWLELSNHQLYSDKSGRSMKVILFNSDSILIQLPIYIVFCCCEVWLRAAEFVSAETSQIFMKLLHLLPSHRFTYSRNNRYHILIIINHKAISYKKIEVEFFEQGLISKMYICICTMYMPWFFLIKQSFLMEGLLDIILHLRVCR